MFINKIRLEESPLAFRCLEQWYRDRVYARHLGSVSEPTPSASSLADMGYRFNLTYYSQQRRSIATATPLTPNSIVSRPTPLSNTIPPRYVHRTLSHKTEAIQDVPLFSNSRTRRFVSETEIFPRQANFRTIENNSLRRLVTVRHTRQ